MVSIATIYFSSPLALSRSDSLNHSRTHSFSQYLDIVQVNARDWQVIGEVKHNANNSNNNKTVKCDICKVTLLSNAFICILLQTIRIQHMVCMFMKNQMTISIFSLFNFNFFLCSFAIEHSLLKISMNRCDAFDIFTLEICFVLIGDDCTHFALKSRWLMQTLNIANSTECA